MGNKEVRKWRKERDEQEGNTKLGMRGAVTEPVEVRECSKVPLRSPSAWCPTANRWPALLRLIWVTWPPRISTCITEVITAGDCQCHSIYWSIKSSDITHKNNIAFPYCQCFYPIIVTQNKATAVHKLPDTNQAIYLHLNPWEGHDIPLSDVLD